MTRKAVHNTNHVSIGRVAFCQANDKPEFSVTKQPTAGNGIKFSPL
jgi:hypothetical protein